MNKWIDEILSVRLDKRTYSATEETGWYWVITEEDKAKAKQAILSHIEKAIGEDENDTYKYASDGLIKNHEACEEAETRNQLRAEIRAKLLGGKDEPR